MKTANLLRTGVGAALILVASAADAAPHRVVAHYMEPRLHPDETRRTVKPPSRADFGDRMQFTSIRSIPDHPGWKRELDRAQAAFRKLLGKASVLGVREIVLGRHQLRGKGREIEDRKAEFERNVAAFARDAAARGIVVRFCNDARDTHAANRLVCVCGEANLRPAQELAAWQHPHPQQALEKVRAQACDFWFLGQPLRTDVTSEPFFTSCGRLADSSEPDRDALLKAVLDKKGRVVFSADYPDVDSEYRDVSLVEHLADR